MEENQSPFTDATISSLSISWANALISCRSLRGSLACDDDPQRMQLLDQFAVWINEGGAGNEPVR